jgi:hypothetical protein
MIHNRIWGPAVGGSPYYICVGVGRTAYACINILYPMYADVRRCGDTRKNGLSWVYIMSNPTMPGYYKIGYTKNTPEERAKQISNATGVIVPMEVEWAFHCYNGFALEQECHHKLEKYRVNNNREFFQMSLEEAKKTIEEIGERYV